MNIDVHNHVIPQRALDLLARDSTYGVKIVDGQWRGPNHDGFKLVESWYSPDAKMDEMDEDELDAAVISVAPRPLYFYELPEAPLTALTRECNLGLAEYCAVHPDRLKWFSHVPLSFPQLAATAVKETMDAGAAGVMIAPSAAGNRIDAPMFDPFWEMVDSLKAPIFLHPGYALDNAEYMDWGLKTVIATPLETTVGLIRLICAGHFDRFKDVTIIGAHGGGYFPTLCGRLTAELAKERRKPGQEDLPVDPWKYVGQIKFDALMYEPDAIRFLIEKAGPENIMIGTEGSFPNSRGLRPVETIRAATGSDEHAFRLVAGENAAKLFGF